MKEVLEKISKFGRVMQPAEALIGIASSMCNVENTVTEMKRKDLLKPDASLGYTLSEKGKILLKQELYEGEAKAMNENEIHQLANDLRDKFPQGRKPGTNLFWRSNVLEVKSKLKKFFSIYGTQWTAKEILDATDRYIAHFGSDDRYMRILPYFIIKMVDGDEGREYSSELLNQLENNSDSDGLPSSGGRSRMLNEEDFLV